ncbi:MAG TPA: cyclic lactone autoinducer peptide [Candidatus Faecisoma merdavium]|nr:cyclic lactone autoinducer peptide [Candidatus Faecisoma merdavium]
MAFVASLLATVGSFLATMGSQACFLVVLDEPECPKSLIK